MTKPENIEEFLLSVPTNSIEITDGQFNTTIIIAIIISCLSFLFIAYNMAQIVILLPGLYSADRRLAFDSIILTVFGFALEFMLITWDFISLALLTTYRWDRWPAKLNHEGEGLHLLLVLFMFSFIRLGFWSYMHKFNYYDSFLDRKPTLDRNGRLKFSAMRMFHFLAFHKAPVLFVERFFYEKYIFDACQGQ